MVDYKCETCEKNFKQKGHYDAHKGRKHPCKKDVMMEALVEKKVQEALANMIVTELGGGQEVGQTSQTIQTPLIKMKPFLKWVGGKTQILDEVLGLFPKEIANYWEPFLGGGSVLLGLLSSVKEGRIKVTGKVCASDLNSNLIGLYKNIQSNPEVFIAEVNNLFDFIHIRAVYEQFHSRPPKPAKTF